MWEAVLFSMKNMGLKCTQWNPVSRRTVSADLALPENPPFFRNQPKI